MSKNQQYSNYVVEEGDEEEIPGSKPYKKQQTLTHEQLRNEVVMQAEDNDDEILPQRATRVIDNENSYQQRRHKMMLSPERKDRSYKDIMKEQQLDNEQADLQYKLQKQQENMQQEDRQQQQQKKESRQSATQSQQKSSLSTSASEWEEQIRSTPKTRNKWDTPSHSTQMQDQTPSSVRARKRWDATPSDTPSRRVGGRFGETPTPGHMAMSMQTPSKFGETPGSQRSQRAGGQRWDDKTPLYTGGQMGETPKQFGGVTPSGMQTPMTPMNFSDMSAEQYQKFKLEKDIDERNRPMTDEEIDAILPGPSEGYEILKPPESYIPLMNPAQRLLQVQQTPSMQTPNMYNLPSDTPTRPMEIPGTPSQTGMPSLKPEDYNIFGSLMSEVNESELTDAEKKDRKIMMLLLKIKNGTPQQRKSSMRQITQNAREFGAGPLFNQILPLLMEPTLEIQERHLLVKVIDRVLYKLGDLVRPYVHKVLMVIETLLIDEDYYARVEGREIISNLAKAAGLNTMITTMRPDIDHKDEFVRNTTARAFAVVASSLGIPSLLPFLKAVCQSKKNWQARHTGIKIVQQISILMGCAILPHLRGLVELIEHGLQDEQPKVRTITALALAALAEAATPYGIEAFDSVLIPLWEGISLHRHKSLGAFLKAIGYIIPLMDGENALEYTSLVMNILIREFTNQEEEMKKVVLKVVKQCVSCPGVDANYVRQNLVEEYFRNFWVRRMAQDKRNYKQLIDTTIEIATKIGGAEVLMIIVPKLKDENESFRKMAMETIEKVVAALGVSDVDSHLEQMLMDGIISAFHEQAADDSQIMLNGFGTVVNALGQRSKPYFSQISGIIQWRLNNKSARVRQQAADLIARIAVCTQRCGEEMRLGKLGVMLYECLGEEYPEVLGSILGGLKSIVNVIGMNKMTPPIKDLLPRLTPILKNRHEKVQENTIDLVGRIADRGAEHVSPKEWMRICFDLLDLLKAHKKGIRRATVNTFGYIAKAIGPQDVLVTLLNNLKVQERQLRVCTTVAIAIVAETCGPYTVIPALMNEYRVQELNVQNGVLKSFSFMFEYIGEVAKDYVYSVIPLLEDALTDRDLVHRQTAASTVKHVALGVQGFGCEDALVNLLNYVFPNIFETSPHVVNAVTEAIDAIRVSLGPGVILLYLLQGLYHPARRVRQVYWRLYNMLYVGNQDSLVAFYPELFNDQTDSYCNYDRSELQIEL